MSENRYNVVISGAALEGFDLSQVKTEFSKLFSLAEAKTEQVFSKGNVVVKKNIAQTPAQNFIVALERIGTAAHLMPMNDEASAAGLQLEPVSAQAISTTLVPPPSLFNLAKSPTALPL